MGNDSNTNPSNCLLHERTESFREDVFELDKPYAPVFGENCMGKRGLFKRRDKPIVPLGRVWIISDPDGSDAETTWITKAVKGPLARMRTALFDWFRQVRVLWQIF